MIIGRLSRAAKAVTTYHHEKWSKPSLVRVPVEKDF
jgi:hypothetical protein